MKLLGSGNPDLTATRILYPEKFEAYLISVFKATKGNATLAAKELNVGVTTIKRWLNDSPTLYTAVRRIRFENAAAKDE